MTDRRRFHLFGVVPVAAVVAVTVLCGLWLHTVEAGHTRGFLYTIEQGGGTLGAVVPLSGAQEVESFYGYPGGAARSDTGLEQPDTSLLFLYEDRNGRVSLVMIHDANDGSGGQVVFDFAGIPHGTTFVVQDDPGEASDVITQPGGTATVRWQWNDVNTDGGALSGALESQAWTLTITPQFPAGGGITPGRITTWKFLTGALDNPTAMGLDLTEPLTITAIPSGLQVVTAARLTAEGQHCRVATDNGPLTVNLSLMVEGMLQIAGQQIINTPAVQQGLGGDRYAVRCRHGHKRGRRCCGWSGDGGRWCLLQRHDDGRRVGLQDAATRRQGRDGAGRSSIEGAQRRQQCRQEDGNPWMGLCPGPCRTSVPGSPEGCRS